MRSPCLQYTAMKQKFKLIGLIARDDESVGLEEVSVVMTSVPQPEEASRCDLKAKRMESRDEGRKSNCSIDHPSRDRHITLNQDDRSGQANRLPFSHLAS